MKTPSIELLEQRLIAVEKATDAGFKANFDAKSCTHLDKCISTLLELVLNDGEDPPVGIDDEKSAVSKALKMVDLAYCCWRNDDYEIPIPDDVLINHITRMKMNAEHCKLVLDFVRLFLNKYDRLLSVESASLRILGNSF